VRALNKNERTLSLALGGAVFLIANLLVFNWATGLLRENRTELARAELTIRESEAMLAGRSYWEARGAWIERNPLETYDGLQSDSAFAESVQRAVQAAGLSVESQSLQSPVSADGLTVAGLELDVRGELREIVRWLNVLQAPGNYVAIEKFTLNRADAESTMRMQARVTKIFRDEGDEEVALSSSP
jgi:hypothetical protein